MFPYSVVTAAFVLPSEYLVPRLDALQLATPEHKHTHNNNNDDGETKKTLITQQLTQSKDELVKDKISNNLISHTTQFKERIPPIVHAESHSHYLTFNTDTKAERELIIVCLDVMSRTSKLSD